MTIFKKETIQKVCKSYRFYQMLKKGEYSPIMDKVVFFDQLFADTMGDLFGEEENLELMQSIEKDIAERYLDFSASLFDLEVLSGLQIVFKDYSNIELPDDTAKLLNESIAGVESDIHQSLINVREKDLDVYGKVLFNELMDLEQVLMDDVAEYLRKRGLTGSVINFGLKGLKIKEI